MYILLSDKIPAKKKELFINAIYEASKELPTYIDVYNPLVSILGSDLSDSIPQKCIGDDIYNPRQVYLDKIESVKSHIKKEFGESFFVDSTVIRKEFADFRISTKKDIIIGNVSKDHVEYIMRNTEIYFLGEKRKKLFVFIASDKEDECKEDVCEILDMNSFENLVSEINSKLFASEIAIEDAINAAKKASKKRCELENEIGLYTYEADQELEQIAETEEIISSELTGMSEQEDLQTDGNIVFSSAASGEIPNPPRRTADSRVGFNRAVRAHCENISRMHTMRA